MSKLDHIDKHGHLYEAIVEKEGKETMRLKKSWVEHNFEPAFLNMVERCSHSKDYIFFDHNHQAQEVNQSLQCYKVKPTYSAHTLDPNGESNLQQKMKIVKLKSHIWFSSDGKNEIVRGPMFFFQAQAIPTDNNGSQDTDTMTEWMEVDESYLERCFGSDNIDAFVTLCKNAWIKECCNGTRSLVNFKLCNPDGSLGPVEKMTNVARFDVTYVENQRQIHAIKYDHEQSAYIGRAFINERNRFEETRLDTHWVENNFAAAFLEQVKGFGKCGRKYLYVPPGDVRKLEEKVEPRNLLICYKQGDQPTCFFSSFASALDYCGLSQEAKEINQFGLQCVGNTAYDQSKLLTQLVIKSVQIKGIAKKWEARRLKITKTELCDVSGVKKEPILVVLRGSDGGISHAISIVGKWIFDSNLHQAIRLTAENLDSCCGPFDCMGVHKAYHFTERHHNKKKRKRT